LPSEPVDLAPATLVAGGIDQHAGLVEDFPSPELRRFGLEALTPKEFLTKIGVLR
jgi:hypothetical protein